MILSDPIGASLSNCGPGTLLPISVGDTEINLTNASIEVGETCRIRVNVETNGTGTFTNTITPDNLTNYQQITIPSNVSANLVVKNIDLHKSFSPSNFQVGGSSVVSIFITNPNIVDGLTNVTFTDTMPTGLTVQLGSGAIDGPGCFGAVDTSDPLKISLTGGTIPAGGSCEITATVTSAIAATYINTASCTDMSFDGGSPGCVDAIANLVVYPSTLGINATKSFNSSNIAPGAPNIMTISVTAPGDTNLTNFTITDNLPSNVIIFNPPSATQNNCGSGNIVAPAGSTTYDFNNGTILAGETCTLTVAVSSTTYGPHSNTIYPGNISNYENRTIPTDISAAFTVRDISVNKEYSNNLIGFDGKTTLTITLTNNFSTPLTDLAFSDSFGSDPSEGIIIATPSNLINTCNGTVNAISGSQNISLSGGSIAGDQSCSITFDVQGKSISNPPLGKTYSNTIEIGDVTGRVNGTTVTQNWATASDGLTVGTPEFRINKKFDPILVTGSYASTMTISLINPLSSPINNITFTDNLPANMYLADISEPNVGTCGGTITEALDRKSFTFSGGNLQANSSCKLTINTIMDVTGNRINTIPAYSVTTTQGATNIHPTSATLTNLSSVGLSKEFSPNPVTPGSVSQLNLTVTKIGLNVGLTGLGLIDNLSGGLTIADPPGQINTCGGVLNSPAGGTVISLSNGEMPIGTDTCTISVNILSPSNSINLEGYANIIPPGTVVTDEGHTNIVPAEDTLGVIFDPPMGIKTFTATGLLVLEWKQVWINNTNSSATNVQISDEIPIGTTYIPFSITCEARGFSITDTCEYDSLNNEIRWLGEIGPDRGAVDEATANNEVVIIFQVNVPDSVNVVTNQANATVDSDGDGEFDDETTTISTSNSNEAVWNRYANQLPASGFAPNRITKLIPQPAELYETYGNLELEIPSLELREEIIGIPKIDNRWEVSWLGNRLGFLEGTAFPTWNGNSVITGHVYDANGQPGIFHNLKTLKWGDEVIVYAFDQIYVYEVRTVENNVSPDDTSSVYQQEDYPWLTLITCRDYDEESNSYAFRVVVRAVLIRID